MVDIIVIGGGPAGLTAAVYARRAGKSVLVLEKDALGGQITWSPKVENYPAVPAVSGMDLGNRMAEQAMDMGAEVEIDEVLRIEDFGSHKRVYGSFGTEYDARAVILAAGARPRKLGLKREDELVGSGVGYCAVCDGAFFKGQAVAVNGGGNSALQDAVLLSDLCSRVYLVHRRDSFRGEEALADQLRGKENVEFVLNAVITELKGDSELSGITVEQDGVQREIPVSGLFVAIGHEPDLAAFADFLDRDAQGYAASDEGCLTKTEGFFVAGDCRRKKIRQVTTAAADGAVAALAACAWLDR
ncbi:MAG: FAD-dependent oxidoreductase [Oscillospiraceae bacterium]|jgi:thioredoxin reductase (NADPH)|nr:FAD-dependent oxidoreductase [Oscillospiraceae bacterium]